MIVNRVVLLLAIVFSSFETTHQALQGNIVAAGAFFIGWAILMRPEIPVTS